MSKEGVLTLETVQATAHHHLPSKVVGFPDIPLNVFHGNPATNKLVAANVSLHVAGHVRGAGRVV